jgi:uncharacterized RDD family membrane protein YckC
MNPVKTNYSFSPVFTSFGSYTLAMSTSNPFGADDFSAPSLPAYRYASFQHRLGAIVLDATLVFITFGIGWLIWSFIVWGEGQTPAKKILKLRTINFTNGHPATWGHMGIREMLVPMSVSIASTLTGGLALIAWIIVEIVFYSSKNQRTLRDYWVKTAVVNES